MSLSPATMWWNAAGALVVAGLSSGTFFLRAMQAQITAEREKRALIAAAEGRKQAQINFAGGQRRAFINNSEGERQAAINRAQGETCAKLAQKNNTTIVPANMPEVSALIGTVMTLMKFTRAK